MIEFLEQSLYATLITLVMIAGYMFYVFKVQRKSIKQWLGQEGEGSIASAALGVGSIILITFILFVITSLLSPAKAESLKGGTWFNDTSVFLGIDQNIWRSEKKVFDINAKYTHHSCVLGKDRNGYDAVGVKFVWFLKRS